MRRYEETNMRVEFRSNITRQMLKDEPDILFVFGDNLQRHGLGGQAKEMRGAANAVGIPTKVAPNMEKDAFFTDNHYHEWASSCGYDLVRLLTHKGKIVWPQGGIGTGRARLAQSSPKIHDAIECILDILINQKVKEDA